MWMRPHLHKRQCPVVKLPLLPPAPCLPCMKVPLCHVCADVEACLTSWPPRPEQADEIKSLMAGFTLQNVPAWARDIDSAAALRRGGVKTRQT